MRTFCSATVLLSLVSCAAAPIRKHDVVRISLPDPPGGSPRTIAAEVVGVRNNGRLVLEACCRRRVDDLVEKIRVSGEAEPWAVTDGVVKAEDLLNLKIECTGDGPAHGGPKAGFSGWLMDALWPFRNEER
ncbi:MAG: flagellar basal body L-ring protein FlgH [Planctomycetes bacterium]|nr:flagellar basal body L-ring protein FlgH [Planctomycetota bacterium]